MGRKKRKPSKPWCWYCNREFDDEKILIQHQKAKHFKCSLCHKKLFTGPGLAIHCLQVHKTVLEEVPNALPTRKKIDIEIYGMEGIPPEDLKHREAKDGGAHSDDETDNKIDNSNQGMVGMPGMPMPGMMPGMPPMPGMMPGMPGMGYGPPMPGNPMGPMGPIPMGIPPNFMNPGGGMQMVGTMPHVPMMPPCTMSSSVSAPAKPLFPAAVAQASSSSQVPVGADFKPLVTAPPRPTFPAYSGGSSPSTSGQISKSHGSAPVSYNTETSSSPQINPEKRSSNVSATKASSRIMHPDEDISLEEFRAQLPCYQGSTMVLGVNPMPMMPGDRMPMPGSGQLLMNGMPMNMPMRPGMGMPPGMSRGMTRMNAPFTGQAVFSQGPSLVPHMMSQAGPRPF